MGGVNIYKQINDVLVNNQIESQRDDTKLFCYGGNVTVRLSYSPYDHCTVKSRY